MTPKPILLRGGNAKNFRICNFPDTDRELLAEVENIAVTLNLQTH